MGYLALIGGDGTVAQVIVLPDGPDPVSYARGMGLEGTVVPCAKAAAAIGYMHKDGGLYPVWRQVFGAGDDPLEAGVTGYPAGTTVWDGGKLWVSLIDANVWQPGVSGWREAGVAPDWVQPTGAHDAYAKGARVSYGGKVWVAQIDANVWAPGVFGWVAE